MNTERWIVGAEHDEQLLEALGTCLRSLGYELDAPSWGVGGSQELSSWSAASPQGSLVVEAETYIGLSVSGPSVLVGAVRERFALNQPANKPLQRTRSKQRASER